MANYYGKNASGGAAYGRRDSGQQSQKEAPKKEAPKKEYPPFDSLSTEEQFEASKRYWMSGGKYAKWSLNEIAADGEFEGLAYLVFLYENQKPEYQDSIQAKMLHAFLSNDAVATDAANAKVLSDEAFKARGGGGGGNSGRPTRF